MSGLLRAAMAAVIVMVTPVPAAAALPAPRATATPPALSVDGNRIVDAVGNAVQLNGVNRSGTEYACAQGWGIFDGPSDDASIAAMATWHVHAVRVPLNEDCWLGINGVNASFGGSSYRSAVADYVARIEAHGMNVILDLHWSAPGTELALGQHAMPDADHSPAFWRSVATTFGQDQAIMFDLFNEPHDVTWRCWLRGCTVDGWRAVGMQRLVNVVRNAGAQNVLLLSGIEWAGDIRRWAAHMPSDPLHRLVASWHVYNFGSCTTATCWRKNVAGVGGVAPVLLAEFGETDCAHAFVDSLMSWADRREIGYVAWTWDDWPGCDGPTLITDYGGTPTAYGVGVRDHFVARFGG